MTPIFFDEKEGATPRQIIETLMQICTEKPELMDIPITIDRPIYEAENDGEFFGIGSIDTIGKGEKEQIMFSA